MVEEIWVTEFSEKKVFLIGFVSINSALGFKTITNSPSWLSMLTCLSFLFYSIYLFSLFVSQLTRIYLRHQYQKRRIVPNNISHVNSVEEKRREENVSLTLRSLYSREYCVQMGYRRPCLCLKVVSFRANVIFLASFFKDDRCY